MTQEKFVQSQFAILQQNCTEHYRFEQLSALLEPLFTSLPYDQKGPEWTTFLQEYLAFAKKYQRDIFSATLLRRMYRAWKAKPTLFHTWNKVAEAWGHLPLSYVEAHLALHNACFFKSNWDFFLSHLLKEIAIEASRQGIALEELPLGAIQGMMMESARRGDLINPLNYGLEAQVLNFDFLFTAEWVKSFLAAAQKGASQRDLSALLCQLYLDYSEGQVNHWVRPLERMNMRAELAAHLPLIRVLEMSDAQLCMAATLRAKDPAVFEANEAFLQAKDLEALVSALAGDRLFPKNAWSLFGGPSGSRLSSPRVLGCEEELESQWFQELPWIADYLLGASLRRLEGFPFRVSKRAAAFFHQDTALPFFSLKRNLAYCTLRAQKIPSPYATAALAELPWADINAQCLDWIKISYRRKVSVHRVADVLDYLLGRQGLGLADLDLRRVPLRKFLRVAMLWKQNRYSVGNINQRQLGQTPLLPIYRMPMSPKVSWEIAAIQVTSDLLLESERMDHCIFSYLSDLLYKPGCAAYSLREIRLDQSRPLLGIWVVNGRIEEVRGRKNRYPSNQELAFVATWAQAQGLIFGPEQYQAASHPSKTF